MGKNFFKQDNEIFCEFDTINCVESLNPMTILKFSRICIFRLINIIKISKEINMCNGIMLKLLPRWE